MNSNFFSKVKEFVTEEKTLAAIRYVLGGIFALCALFNGFHFSSLFMLAAAFLMMPFAFVRSALNRWKFKPIFAIVLSVAMVLVFFLTAPTEEGDEEYIPADLASLIEDQKESEKSEENKAEGEGDKTGNENKPETGTDPDKTDPETDNNSENPGGTEEGTSGSEDNSGSSSQDPDEPTQGESSDSSDDDPNSKTETVWISATGSKYHSKPDCSGMKNPKEISLEEAESKNLEPCKKCHQYM